MARKALQRGHEFSVISTWHQNPQFEVPGVQFYHYSPRTRRLRTIPIVLYVRRLLRELKPDLMLSSIPPFDGFLAALTGFHPHVAHAWGTDILHVPYTSWVLRQKTRFTLRKADAVLCSSSELQGIARELCPGPTSKYPVLPLHSVDCDAFTPGPSSLRRDLGWHDKRILIMTRNPYPVIYGIEFFIEALPLVLREASQTRVILVGSGSMDVELRERVAALGLQDIVHFAGRVEHSSMPTYLNAADIYVSMSLTDATSVSLLEAMACGLPVVLSDIPDNRDWVVSGENGLLVNIGPYPAIRKAIQNHLRRNRKLWSETKASSRDYPLPVSSTCSEDIASALIALLRDSDAREEMGRRNRQIARERGDLDKQFAEFERLAEQLIGESQ